MNKAVFLDRDGVINIDKHYVYKIEDFEFKEGIFQVLRHLEKLNYKLFIITNQSGIGRQYYTNKDFNILNTWMLKELKKEDIKISQVEYCPHHPEENCQCRKPKVGMIKNILKNYEVDLSESWLIGDKNSDINCAINAQIKNTIFIDNNSLNEKNKASFMCSSLIEIISIIKS